MTSEEVTHGGRSSPAASSCRVSPGPSVPPPSAPSPPLPPADSVAAAASAAALGKRSWYLFSSVDSLRTCSKDCIGRQQRVAQGGRVRGRGQPRHAEEMVVGAGVVAGACPLVNQLQRSGIST